MKTTTNTQHYLRVLPHHHLETHQVTHSPHHQSDSNHNLPFKIHSLSACTGCTLTNRQTEQNINYRRSKNNARRVDLVTGRVVFVHET